MPQWNVWLIAEWQLTCVFLCSLCQTEDPLANCTILYQMVALCDYAAEGPEDLEFSEGDTIDILSEGNGTGEMIKCCVF
jgi:hypothetical protein